MSRPKKTELEKKNDALKKEIKESQAYLKEQELLIAKTIDDGNIRIDDLDFTIRDLLKKHETALDEYNELAKKNNVLKEKSSLIIQRLIAKEKALDLREASLNKNYTM